jgi:hypothetical protein
MAHKDRMRRMRRRRVYGRRAVIIEVDPDLVQELEALGILKPGKREGAAYNAAIAKALGQWIGAVRGHLRDAGQGVGLSPRARRGP